MTIAAQRTTSRAWYAAIALSGLACVVASAILYFGSVDIQEGNAAWQRAAPQQAPRGNLAVRTAWGVSALVLSPAAYLLLGATLSQRNRLALLPERTQWLLAVGLPVGLTLALIALCAVGVLLGGPLVLPFPPRP